MANKVTKRDVFNAVIDMVDGKATSVAVADIKAAMEHEIELLNKKSAKAAGPNPEFAELEKKIMEFMANHSDVSASDIGKGVGITSQKAAPRLKALVEAGKLSTSTVKGKTLYKA